MGYSESDMVNWGRLVQRNLAATGVAAGTRVHNAYGYGLFTGGLGFETGLQAMGATVLPASSAPDVEQHLELMHQHRAQVLLSTPGLALALAEAVGRDASLRPPDLQAGIFGGDGWSPALRRHIEGVLGIRAHDTYGLSEVLGPGVAHACEHGNGLHLYEDAFLPEVLEPDNGVPLTPGTDGELVLTSLLNEASPRLRYRTGDRVRIERGRCPCGRTSARLVNVVRAEDVRIYAGRALAPNDIEAALLQMDAVAPTFRVVAPGRELDALSLEVEPKASPPRDFEDRVRRGMESLLDVPVGIRVLEPGSLERSRGKRLLLVDRPWRSAGAA
jgi:phenylacetate-CoA ligase